MAKLFLQFLFKLIMHKPQLILQFAVVINSFIKIIQFYFWSQGIKTAL
jgi:hypothetical protein